MCSTRFYVLGWEVKVAGLFAGIGGFERGLAAAGHEPILLSEIWEPARAVLAAKLPAIPCKRDIRELKTLPRDAELITAGFPCQDLSQAGQTLGIGGSRSGLVGEVFRLLDRRRVSWVVLENVSFMLQLDKGSGMRTLVDAFEERGYRWAYRVVNSLSFVPQRRERVIFVATTTETNPASVILTDEAQPRLLPTNLDAYAHGFYWTEGIRGLGWASDSIPTLKNGSTVGIASPPAILLPSGDVITPDIRDAERLQGFPVNWTQPAEQAFRASLRWSLVGNAVTVPVAAWLGKRLARPGEYDVSRDDVLPVNGRWPTAARYDGNRRYAVRINSYPKWEARSALTQFLRHDGKRLSARATRGFLSRTERAKLRFAEGFQDRLRDHLARMEASDTASAAKFSIAAE
jgi:DNA (cytosine-5)-methyltransferase 1